MVERSSNRIKLFPVDKRDAATLLTIITNNVAAGSTIFTDGWSGYNGLQAAAYTHLVVEHKKHLVDSAVTHQRVSLLRYIQIQ